MTLIGYLDHLSCRAGDQLSVRASSDHTDVHLDLVRLLHGDENPSGPGFLIEQCESVEAHTFQGTLQQCRPGSFAYSEAVLNETPGAVTVEVRIWPTLPADGRRQGVVSVVDRHGSCVAAVAVDEEGRVAVVSRDAVMIETTARLRPRRWYEITASWDENRSELTLTALEPLAGDLASERLAGPGVRLEGSSGVLAAALSVEDHGSSLSGTGLYNGKIENPRLSRGADCLLHWAFEVDSGTQRTGDHSGNGHHARLINFPTRSVTSSAFDGTAQRVGDDPSQYAAIHFHDDDLLDAGWEVSATVDVPLAVPPGIYAIRLQGGGETDYIPFVLRRPETDRSSPRTLLVLPTYTYVAYANERLIQGKDFEGAGLLDHQVNATSHDRLLAAHPEWGASLYDLHRDGSGTCYSSHRRPVPNLRPDYRSWLQNAPRHLAAELYTSRLLEMLGIDFDVITDHDIAAEGSAAMRGYDVILTGSHPEYCSGTMLDAFENHLGTGGSLLYLGGNGFYWVTSADPERSDVLEVRRWGGIRAWEAGPGEFHHSTSGELGGLWRYRGRAPNKLVGVGMSSQGWDAKASAFRRREVSFDPLYSWVFDGITDDLIGDFGLIMNGTSGDEIDRFDLTLGSPPNGVVLATSTPHSAHYKLTVEDVPMLTAGLEGGSCSDVRSDVVLIEQASGGAVFSIGSICFSGAFPVNNFDNNITRLVSNVLTNFLSRPR